MEKYILFLLITIIILSLIKPIYSYDNDEEDDFEFTDVTDEEINFDYDDMD